MSAATAREFEFTRQDFDFLRRLSNEHTGIVVSDDKFDMFYSRLSRRVRLLGLPSFRTYCELLSGDPNGAEFREFINAITTNLTSFFREKHHFEALRDEILPTLLKGNAGTRRIRIWSAGCSTGEEPYSIAMTVSEALGERADWDVKILATDIDSNVLATAAEGVYPDDRLQAVDPGRVKRWFRRGTGRQEGLAKAAPELQSLISFRQLNLMGAWPMHGPFDVIFCRNVIIYFDKATKIRLVHRFHDYLSAAGRLILGHSESLYQVTERFDLIGHTIYKPVRGGGA